MEDAWADANGTNEFSIWWENYYHHSFVSRQSKDHCKDAFLAGYIRGRQSVKKEADQKTQDSS